MFFLSKNYTIHMYVGCVGFTRVNYIFYKIVLHAQHFAISASLFGLPILLPFKERLLRFGLLLYYRMSYRN